MQLELQKQLPHSHHSTYHQTLSNFPNLNGTVTERQKKLLGNGFLANPHSLKLVFPCSGVAIEQ